MLYHFQLPDPVLHSRRALVNERLRYNGALYCDDLAWDVTIIMAKGWGTNYCISIYSCDLKNLQNIEWYQLAILCFYKRFRIVDSDLHIGLGDLLDPTLVAHNDTLRQPVHLCKPIAPTCTCNHSSSYNLCLLDMNLFIHKSLQAL